MYFRVSAGKQERKFTPTHDDIKFKLYMGKYLPSFYFHPLCPCYQGANLRLGEIVFFFLLSFFAHNCVSANLHRAKETISKSRKAKITRDENNPVCSSTSVSIAPNFRHTKVNTYTVLHM